MKMFEILGVTKS